MKKRIAAGILGITLLSLAGCGASSAPVQETPEIPVQEETAPETSVKEEAVPETPETDWKNLYLS